MEASAFLSLLARAVEARSPLFDPAHRSAFRLFNGFSEGEPDLVIDLYASTLVFHSYAEDPAAGMELVRQARDFLLSRHSWLRAGIVKTRNISSPHERGGQLPFGEFDK